MNDTDDKAIELMKRSISAYAGPVTRCPPGRARAPADAATVRDSSVEWPMQNRGVRPVRNTKIERRQMRMARARQQRIAKRNAALLKRVND